MNEKNAHIITRINGPFDSSARDRLRHMGILNANNEMDPAVMPVFAGVFCGLFFDDICGHYKDMKDLWVVYRTFMELFERKDYQHMYLFFSIQYDNMRRPLPDPVWWLAGSQEAVREFMRHFIRELSKHITELGLLESGEEAQA